MERALKNGVKQYFFTHLDPFWKGTEEEFNDLKPRTVHHKSKWKASQNAVYWINLGKAQEKGLQCWQTRSHATTPCDSVPADCVEKSSEPQKRHNFVSKNSYATTSSENRVEGRMESRAWQTINQAARNRARRARNLKRPSKKLGKIELIEWGEVSTNIQCSACAKYCPEGQLYCTCGICIKPSKDEKRRIKNHHVVKKNYSRGAKHGASQEQCDNSTRKEEIVFVDYGQMARRRVI